MILRRTALHDARVSEEEVTPSAAAAGGEVWATRTTLRWRLALLTFAAVAFSVGAMTVITYWSMTTTLTQGIDRELDSEATVLLHRSVDPFYLTNLDVEVQQFKSFNPDTRVSVSPPGWSFSRGDAIPVGGEAQGEGRDAVSVRTVGNERILAKTDSAGGTVVLAKDMQQTHGLITSLAAVLLFIAVVGTLLAIAAGTLVAAAGLKPVQRLQRAVDYVAETDDLRPIAVQGKDELAQLTTSFNKMLSVLQDSRTRQAQLVADAGHELKTPLTSLRTNIELLMMLHQPGNAARLSEQDRRDLERDVMAQMTELSTLIGDLVDLAREDAADTVLEDVELDEVIESSLARVRRRRNDVSFEVVLVPWTIIGDQFSLGRAMLNLLDNAAKWSPADGVVRVTMTRLADDRVQLTVDDSGPGVRPEDRERVFERFYRAPEVRSQPGSGLGLAIVKQTIVRHQGRISIGENPAGGTRVIVELPGKPQVSESR